MTFATACLFVVGCERPEPVVLTLQGDSIILAAELTFEGGARSGECAFSVTAVATGPEGTAANVKSGSVVYTLAQTGDTLMNMPLDSVALASIFKGATSIAAGSSVEGSRQAISISTPVPPLRGRMTLDYTTEGVDSTLTTAPFNFKCNSAQ